MSPYSTVSSVPMAVQSVKLVQKYFLNFIVMISRLEPLSTIQINVFDEYKSNILDGFSEEDRSSKTVHFRYNNRWLGTLHIPLYAVLSLGIVSS